MTERRCSSTPALGREGRREAPGVIGGQTRSGKKDALASRGRREGGRMTCQGGGTCFSETVSQQHPLKKMPWQVGEEGRGGRKTCQGGGTYSVVVIQYVRFSACHPLSYIFFDLSATLLFPGRGNKKYHGAASSLTLNSRMCTQPVDTQQ